MFTTRVTAATGTTCIKNNDFSAVITCAKSCPPYPTASPAKAPSASTTASSSTPHLPSSPPSKKKKSAASTSSADATDPNLHTDYAKAVPQDAFILTLGCGKFRINNHDYGTLLGLPRLLDMGQCNDAYSAIQTALALAKAFNCSVNELPLTIVLSWLEQKAVAVLLTLLSLNVQSIIIGPTPPAFVSPNVFQILQEKFKLRLVNRAG